MTALMWWGAGIGYAIIATGIMGFLRYWLYRGTPDLDSESANAVSILVGLFFPLAVLFVPYSLGRSWAIWWVRRWTANNKV